MKFRAHDTFFIRKGWLNKGMKYVLSKPNIFIDKNENPMDVLGIGANMVKALRYWLPTVGLTVESTKRPRIQTFTSLGNSIYDHDRYLEEFGTLYLLHYKLVTNHDNATSWYYFFNEFILHDFTKNDFVEQITSYIKMQENSPQVALRSLNDDFTCIMNTYIPRYRSDPKKVMPENNIDCPFGDLGLIDILNKDKRGWIYKKAIPPADNFDPWVILAVIYDQAKGREEISLNELLMSPGNIGKVFNFDSISMLEVLRKAESTGKLKIIRTAGLDVIHLLDHLTFQECVDQYYRSIETIEETIE